MLPDTETNCWSHTMQITTNSLLPSISPNRLTNRGAGRNKEEIRIHFSIWSCLSIDPFISLQLFITWKELLNP
jgi:hypothetical protein